MADSVAQKRISRLLDIAKKYGASREQRLAARGGQQSQSASGIRGQAMQQVAPWREGGQGGALTPGQDVGGAIFEGYDERGYQIYNAPPMQVMAATPMPKTPEDWFQLNLKGNMRRRMTIDPNMPESLKMMALMGDYDFNKMRTPEAAQYARSLGIQGNDYFADLGRSMGSLQYSFGEGLISPENMGEIKAASSEGRYTGFEPVENVHDKELRERRAAFGFGPARQ